MTNSRLEWYFLLVVAIIAIPFAAIVITGDGHNRTTAEAETKDLSTSIVIEACNSYKFYPRFGINYKEYKNVGVTYYAIGEPSVPSITMRSGRNVYSGAIAVSQNMWGKKVSAGDMIYVKALGRWFIAEDTMHEKYTENRVDIFTHDMKLAKSGSSRSDIIILRQPPRLYNLTDKSGF
jgi:hypothetical protein